MTHWLRTHAGIGPILPFLVQILNHEHDENESGQKKMVILKMLVAISRNANVSLEFQLHQVIAILTSFLMIEDNSLKPMTSKLLASLLYEYEEKYPQLKESLFDFFAEILFSAEGEIDFTGIFNVLSSNKKVHFPIRHPISEAEVPAFDSSPGREDKGRAV